VALNLWIEIQALLPERKQVAGLNLWIEIQDLVRERKQVAGLKPLDRNTGPGL
jgi:hypothetical protein